MGQKGLDSFPKVQSYQDQHEKTAESPVNLFLGALHTLHIEAAVNVSYSHQFTFIMRTLYIDSFVIQLERRYALNIDLV